MISRVIEFSIRRRFLVILAASAVSLWGLYCFHRMPVDAIPDLSENQVLVWTDWHGHGPREVEDQISYPLSVGLQGLSGVKSVRASSEFGFSMISVIFQDHVDFSSARQRVLEKLSTASALMPPGVTPYLGTDATALGQVYWYTVEGDGRGLDELRAIQDWYVRTQLYVQGVAEVASIGGFVREYQIAVDPGKLRVFDLSLGEVFEAVMRSNASMGGKVLQHGGSEYLLRSVGWIRSLGDLRKVVVAERHGIPITIDQIGSVQLGPAFRRGLLEKGGSEAVGGVVVMRQGENPLSVIERVKAQIQSLQAGLPPGVRIVPFYDRTSLIAASMETLTTTLLEEIAIASLVVFLVLRHVGSALVICITLPIAVLVSFILMDCLNISSNIMSLSGILISIGVLVDAGIVMTENAYNRLQERFAGGKVSGDTRAVVLGACQMVGGPIFFAILIMLLSFAPLFFLGGLEGKMFTPLATTKSFALLGVGILSVTLVPALIPTLVRGRLKSQREVWVVRSVAIVYQKLLEFFLRNPDVIVVVTGLLLVVGLPIFPRKMPWILFTVGAPFILGASTLLLARRKLRCLAIFFVAAFISFLLITPRGEEFMPPLDELSLLDMPVTRPGVNLTQGANDLKNRNEILRGLPEAHQVVGKLGRADTPTDPAPLDMVETILTLKPKEWWPRRKISAPEVLHEARAAAKALSDRGFLSPGDGTGPEDLAALAAPGALHRFDRLMRALCASRLAEEVPAQTRDLVLCLRRSVVSFLLRKGELKEDLPPERWRPLEDELVLAFAKRFDEWILVEDLAQAGRRIADYLAAAGVLRARADLWAKEKTLSTMSMDLLSLATEGREPTVFEEIRGEVEHQRHRTMAASVAQLNWELEDRAPRALVESATDAVVASARAAKRLAREPSEGELQELELARGREAGRSPYLQRKLKSDLVEELDADLQVPGWSNIWTQPIINRIDMLSTGVRTEIGVKVFGKSFDEIQSAARDIAAALKAVRGAADVTASQVSDQKYLEISVDRGRAARYGLNVEDVQSQIEMALGTKEISTNVEGRERFAVRLSYPRGYLGNEENVKRLLISQKNGSMAHQESGGPETHRRIDSSTKVLPQAPGGHGEASAADAQAPNLDPSGKGAFAAPLPRGATARPEAAPRLLQVPLSLVADVRVATGPAMVQSENGLLCAFVSLNVRGRDIVGFVEEARRTVEEEVKLPPGCYLQWCGQFEHQVHAQRTLALLLPLVIGIIFAILYLTFRDFADTLMMFLAVPGAVAGGAVFQFLLPKLGVDVSGNFSVAVWVGYIACFGLATETSIVMLVYLREAIAKRGGMDQIRSEAEIKAAVIEGAVHRLRPKLLTEGTTLLALIPMLWATGVGAEYMRPMAVPILGGILVADEVIDLFIPVLFYWERCRRLSAR